ncbi:MAG: chromate efflux transporter [Armatimonadota bacterium]
MTDVPCESTQQEGAPPSLIQLARASTHIGLTGYGGGPAIIGLMYAYFVDRLRWLTPDNFNTGLSLSQLLPGAQALSVITFVGYRLRGVPGAIIAALSFLLPVTLVMTILSAVYFAYGGVPIARALFTGLGAVVVSLLVYATVTMGRAAIRDVPAAFIALAAFLVMFSGMLLRDYFPNWRPHVFLIVLIGAVAGLLVYRRQSQETLSTDSLPASCSAGSDRRWWIALLVFVVAIAAVLYFTRYTPAAQLVMAMLRVGIFTFGGGFAAIPLFQHEATVVHPWLTPEQFVDGIALGQITPGPVLITATFIGYHILGWWGALLATLAVFAPGGMGMLALAHVHTHLQTLWWLRAMVRGIVAAFIGLLLSITIQFAQQSLFTPCDWRTIFLAVAGVIVLLGVKKDPVWVIIGGAVLSLLLFWK